MSHTAKRGGGENIRVVIRCRNLLPYELERGDKAMVTMDLATNQTIVNHPIGDPDTFAFDAVYNNTYSQRDIFLQEVQPLVEAVLQGYNATVFAYGQSGSGKTHTMTGKLDNKELWGMMPQVVDHMFNECRKLTSSSKSFKLRCSYVELYNGRSRDLLAKKQVNLEIKQNMAKNFYVRGAEMPEVTSFEECLRYFNEGTNRRQTASTDLNDQSSRSHSLFTIQVEQFDFENDPSAPIVITSKINVVDLAGSEKLSKTNATGDTAKEGCNINLSLSALATVIDTIVKGGKHIPYRGSPLTMLLKDSLGGNAKTVMFANIGPSDKNTSETISTLRFAMRAKQIKNKPIKNLDPKDARIQELLDKVEELQRRLGGGSGLEEEENLKQRIEELEVENAGLRGSTDKDNVELEEVVKTKEAEVEKLKKVAKKFEKELAKEKSNLQLMESNLSNDRSQLTELKSVNINFIKRVCTEDQLQQLCAKMPQDGTYNLTRENWEFREIQFYLQGFAELYEQWRKTSFTEDDMKKYALKATEDVQGQIQRQLDEALRAKAELERQHTEDVSKRTSEQEAASHMRVELTAMKEENSKLREKITRDQEKIKAKLQKTKEEFKALNEALDQVKQSAVEKDRDIEKLKRLLEDNASRGIGGPVIQGDEALTAKIEQIAAEKAALEMRLRETHVALRRKGFCIQEHAGSLGLGDDAPPPPGDAANEAFILAAADEEVPVDGDLLGHLQQQIRVQHRLHELRHQQQKKLDDMVKKYELLKTGKVTPNSAEDGAPMEVVAAKVAEAVAAKQLELDALTEEKNKTCDKLVKKLNKSNLRIQELEKTVEEEKAQFDEEHTELERNVADLQKYNQQLSLEIESLRGQFTASKESTESITRAKDTEIEHLNRELQLQVSNLETLKSKASQYDTIKKEFDRLREQNQRSELSLREKIDALDSNRQMITWSNNLLEEEKSKVAELEQQIRDQERQAREAEEKWRQQIAENANKLVAINNKRLEEQAAQYQEYLTEEQEKHKTIVKKLKNAKSSSHKAAQRYDEMVLENEALLVKFEELKLNSMKMFLEKEEAQRDLDAFRPTSNFSPRNY